MPQQTPLAEMLSSLRLLVSTGAASGSGLPELLQEWKTFFAATMPVDITPQHVSQWDAKLASMINKPDRQGELELIAQASQEPLFGLSLVVAALPSVMKRQAQAWWDSLFMEQGTGDALAGWRLKTLPPAGPGPGGRKYLIVSDVHRDALSDDKGLLKPGSIDHFTGNSALYERVLDFATSEGYTVVEGGDCEELWFVASVADYPKKADGTLDIAAKLREIIASHPTVYAKLRVLHGQGRYVRIQGNHDSFLKRVGSDDTVGSVLRAEMELGSSVPFEIYDGCVIEGVKTMFEKSAGDALVDAYGLASGQLSAAQFTEKLLAGRLGLDPSAYVDKCRMLVCHGHQFDFWNCPDNEILGMIIANTVGTFADRQMDPFLDAKGVAWQGNPLVDFGDLFSGLPVFDSWPEQQAAVRLAHNIQHMENSARRLNDNVMFNESVAALFGAFGVALNHRDGNGNVVTPQQSRASLAMTTPAGIREYLRRHHFHHICIGHTHAPHSQPFMTLDNIGALALPLLPVIGLVKGLLPDFLEPQVKSNYFNSGTAGWMDGVIWAVEIDETGQARLVYWTRNSLRPEYMDWELQKADPALTQAQLIEALTSALNAAAGSVQQAVQDIDARIRARLAQMNVSAAAMKERLESAVFLPMHALALSLLTRADQYVQQQKLDRRWELMEIGDAIDKAGKAIEDKAQRFAAELEKLRDFTLDVFLSIKRRAFSGFASSGDVETLSIRAPISNSARTRLDRLTRTLRTLDPNDLGALHCAAFAFASFDQFPRHMPFFASMSAPLNGNLNLHTSEAPVLQAFLSTLWFYPRHGQVVNVQGVSLRSRFSISGNVAHLSVELRAASPLVS